MLDKTYGPREVEAKLYPEWEQSGAFANNVQSNADALHHHDAAAERHRLPAHRPRAEQHPAGHADPLRAACAAASAVAARHRPCRHRHPDGGRAPAGRSRASSRRELGRDAFVEKVWEWKAESGGTITSQLRRLGASRDWARERFTMDEGLSAAVRKVFVAAAPRGPDLPRQAAGELGPAVPDRHLRPRGRAAGGQGPVSGTSAIRSRARPGASSSSPPPGRRPCWATPPSPCIRTTSATRTWSASTPILPLVGRPHPDRRRRVCRPREGLGRGEDHPGARLQRLRGRQAPRPAADQHPRRATRA